MENTVDRLVDRIYRDAVDKAAAEGAAVKAAADKAALEVLSRAETQAAEIVARARSEAEKIKSSADSEMRFAAAQTIGALRREVADLIRSKLVGVPVEQAAGDVEFVRRVISALAAQAGSDKLEVTVPESMRAEIAGHFEAAVRGTLPGLQVFGGAEHGGFTVAQVGADWRLDFTDVALLEFFSRHLKPATAALFRAT